MKEATPMMPDNYQAASDAHTMMEHRRLKLEHQKIKSDPKRHAAALAHMKGKLAEIQGAMGEGKDTAAHEKAEGPKKEAAEKKAGQG